MEVTKSAILEYKKFLIKLIKNKDFIRHYINESKIEISYHVGKIEHFVNLEIIYVPLKTLHIYLKDPRTMVLTKPVLFCRFNDIDNELYGLYLKIMDNTLHSNSVDFLNSIPKKYTRVIKIKQLLDGGKK